MGKKLYGRSNTLMAGMLSILVLFGTIACREADIVEKKSIYELKREFIDLRFGMFICYNIMTYGAKWNEANYPIESFNPEKLDCRQWADAAVSAGMTFGLLTTKHHEGFCLWDSKFTEYDVAGAGFERDVVAEYVEAFRDKGMKIALYFSILDSHHGIERGSIDSEDMDFIKGQIRELLGNYGKVDYFVVDGWFWNMGHDDVDWFEIRNLIRELQPECLLTDHTHLVAPYRMDIPYFEGPYGAYPSEGNTMASAIGHCSVRGNGWFWSPKTPDGMFDNDGVDVVLGKLNDCEARYCNFMLNCMPNRDGLLDTIYLDMLAEIGQHWSADQDRPPLPNPGKEVVDPVRIVAAEASSGDPSGLFDGKMIPNGPHSTWISDTVFPQTIIVDLGEVQEVDALMIVNDTRVKPAPERALEEGNLMRIEVYTGMEKDVMNLVAKANWPPNNQYRNVGFELQKARYLKINVKEVNGPRATIVALEVGRSFLP